MSMILLVYATILLAIALGGAAVKVIDWLISTRLKPHRVVVFTKGAGGTLRADIKKASLIRDETGYKFKVGSDLIPLFTKKSNPESGVEYNFLVGKRGELWGFYHLTGAHQYIPVDVRLGEKIELKDLPSVADLEHYQVHIQKEMWKRLKPKWYERYGGLLLFVIALGMIAVICIVIANNWSSITQQTTQAMANIAQQLGKVATKVTNATTNATAGGW